MPVPFWDRDEFRYDNNKLDPKGRSPWNSTFLDRNNNVLAWDTGSISGKQLPGIMSVQAEPHRRVDRKVPKDSNREQIKVTGYTPSDITITVKVWTSEQWKELQAIVNKVWKGPTKGDLPTVNVSHRNLIWLGIEQMQITSVTVMSDASEHQAKQMTIKGIEFVDQPSVPKKLPKGRAKATNINSAEQLAPLKTLGGGHTPAAKPASTAPASTDKSPTGRSAN